MSAAHERALTVVLPWPHGTDWTQTRRNGEAAWPVHALFFHWAVDPPTAPARGPPSPTACPLRSNVRWGREEQQECNDGGEMPRYIRIVTRLRAQSHDMRMACSIFLAGDLGAARATRAMGTRRRNKSARMVVKCLDVSELSQGYVLNHMECT